MKYWLMKSEPDTFGLDDLKNRPDQTEPWDGVRNYQARNMMRDEMRPGDGILFYHSNCDVPGIVGLAEVASEPYPDHTQFDPDSKYFDPKSTSDNPRWILVDVKFRSDLPRPLPLAELREHAEQLGDFPLLRKGNRLSVMPVSAAHWRYLMALAKKKAP